MEQTIGYMFGLSTCVYTVTVSLAYHTVTVSLAYQILTENGGIKRGALVNLPSETNEDKHQSHILPLR